MAVIIMLAVCVEAKRDNTAEGVHPWVATPDELAGYAGEHLGYATGHDGQLGWRTTAVTAVSGKPIPTSVRRLREIARDRKLDAEEAGRRLEIAEQRQLIAEEELARAEKDIAPPGFYLMDGNGS